MKKDNTRHIALYAQLGKNISIRRKSLKLSQEELAEQVKISRNSISLIETGKINPTILKVIDITKALNVDINALIKDV